MLKLGRVLRSLPFEPMALSTFDVMERKAASSSVSKASNEVQESPYFISPKHDGVRVVSYVHPLAEKTRSTCFSRFGRPIYGMSWIEEELRILRWLCGDPQLVLDGELYIHGRRPLSSHADGRTVQTGFLAVSALVHRLRRAKSACFTQEEALKYVAALPSMCVFDIVSFQPTERIRLASERSNRGLSQIQKERMSILREVMAANHILDLEMVRVIPNHSVFSQRLKALHFLASLLERARSSCPFFADPALETAQGHNSAEPLGETLNACGVSAGGRYVKLIRYSLITSLEEARSVYLKKYLSDGYEGAVIRSAANVYEVREKKKGVLQGLLNPLLPSSRTSSTVWHEPCGPRWDTPRDTDDERTLRGHAKNGCIFTCDPTRPPTPERGRGKRETDEEIDHREIVMKVFKRAKRNSSRSVTVTKLLPSADKEYAILKPLLKVSTNNAWSRNLLRVPLVSIRGCLDALVVPRASRRAGSCKKCDDEADSTVVFYGLQCLSDTGRVFNVALPKMDSERQQALLGHLLEATGCRRGGGVVVSGRMGRRSLTGLYATVKYPSLTEHGVPRFGQVKAIRGRRGWFL